MAAIGGISSAAILAAINAGAQAAGDSESSSLWAVALFLFALFLFVRSQPYVTTTITAEIEAIIHKLRVRLMDAVRRSELLAIDDIGRSRIVAAINSDSGVLTQASNTLVYSMQSVVLIFFISIYVAYLSIAAIDHERGDRRPRRNGLPLAQPPPDAGASAGGGAGAPAIRPHGRLPRRLQGGEAQ